MARPNPIEVHIDFSNALTNYKKENPGQGVGFTLVETETSQKSAFSVHILQGKDNAVAVYASPLADGFNITNISRTTLFQVFKPFEQIIFELHLSAGSSVNAPLFAPYIDQIEGVIGYDDIWPHQSFLAQVLFYYQ